MFNETAKKYQLNISGMIFSSLDENGKTSVLIDLKKDKDDISIQIEFLNYIISSIFYELDMQLLFSEEKIDLSIIDKFDIDNNTKETILKLYKEKRNIIEEN